MVRWNLFRMTQIWSIVFNVFRILQIIWTLSNYLELCISYLVFFVYNFNYWNILRVTWIFFTLVGCSFVQLEYFPSHRNFVEKLSFIKLFQWVSRYVRCSRISYIFSNYSKFSYYVNFLRIDETLIELFYFSTFYRGIRVFFKQHEYSSH